MNYLIENTKKFYLDNKQKVNKYFVYGFGISLLYYNPYLFFNTIIFILVFNNINAEIRVNTENTFKIPEFNINGNFKFDEIKTHFIDINEYKSTENSDLNQDENLNLKQDEHSENIHLKQDETLENIDIKTNEILDNYLSNDEIENSIMYKSVIFDSDSDTETFSHINWKNKC